MWVQVPSSAVKSGTEMFPIFLRVSNSPCTDKHGCRRRELALMRMYTWLAVYGGCRDSPKPRRGAGTCRHGELLHNLNLIRRMPRQSQAAKRRRDLSAWRIALFHCRHGELPHIILQMLKKAAAYATAFSSWNRRGSNP